MNTLTINLPKWHDLHAHFRQAALLRPMIQAHIDMGCVGILAMPNTRPPVDRVFKKDATPAHWSIEDYTDMIKAAGGDVLDSIIVPLYLTADTTPKMIEDGAKSGLLRACKYYPPHGTTGAEHAADFSTFAQNGVFSAMAQCGVILCTHGEEHGMRGGDYFSRSTNAEEHFYRERLPRVVERFPALKIVAEHLTTKVGVDFVRQAGENVAASVTPQHLLYTIGDLLQGLKYHLFCMPIVKFDEDVEALRRAVTDKDNTQFFAGTDSAPHTKKATPCGCAAGCFTGGIAPQMYAQAFEEAGIDLAGKAGQDAFTRFLSLNGPRFYGLPVSKETFTLVKEPQEVKPLDTPDGPVVPLALGVSTSCAEGKAMIPWSLKPYC